MRALLKSLALLVLLLCFVVNGEKANAAAEKIKMLIVTGFDVGSHQWEASTKLMRSILEKTGRFDVSISTDKEVFASPSLGPGP